MLYVHHVPRTAAADELTRVIEAAEEAVSPTVSRTDDFEGNSAQLSDPQHA
jgi:hypothetical protein